MLTTQKSRLENCVIRGKLPTFSGPHIPHLSNKFLKLYGSMNPKITTVMGSLQKSLYVGQGEGHGQLGEPAGGY